MSSNIVFGVNASSTTTTGSNTIVIGWSALDRLKCTNCHIILHKYKPKPKNIHVYTIIVSDTNKLEVYYQYERNNIIPICMHYKKYNTKYKDVYPSWITLYMVYVHLAKNEPVYKDILFNIVQYYIPLIIANK